MNFNGALSAKFGDGWVARSALLADEPLGEPSLASIEAFGRFGFKPVDSGPRKGEIWHTPGLTVTIKNSKKGALSRFTFTEIPE